jgi:hypothetical protein
MNTGRTQKLEKPDSFHISQFGFERLSNRTLLTSSSTVLAHFK